MNAPALDQMGDGERISVDLDLDWRLLNRLEAERSFAKGHPSWVEHMREDGVLACPEDRDWFREHPQRRAYVRTFTEDEIDLGWLKLDENDHLVLVRRIRVADNDRIYGPDAVMAAEEVGEIVVVRESFKVHDIDEDLELYRKIEEVVGSEVFDTALRLWLSTSEIPQIVQPDGTLRPRSGPYLQYWRLDVIVEELYPGATQVLCPQDAPLA